MRTLCMEVKITKHKNGFETIVTKSASMDGRNLSFEVLGAFLVDIESINKMLKTAIKNDYFTEFEIRTYDYDESITNFREWKYTGYPMADGLEASGECAGVYLRPDTRYVPEHHDIMYDFKISSITDSIYAYNPSTY